jgi:hypothetical protein
MFLSGILKIDVGQVGHVAEKILIPYKITFILSFIHKKSPHMPTYPTITNRRDPDSPD